MVDLRFLASWFLTIAGMLFIALGFTAAAFETVRDLIERARREAREAALPDLESITELLKAFNQVLRTLLGSPRWLLMVAVGVGLVLVGNLVL